MIEDPEPGYMLIHGGPLPSWLLEIDCGGMLFQLSCANHGRASWPGPYEWPCQAAFIAPATGAAETSEGPLIGISRSFSPIDFVLDLIGESDDENDRGDCPLRALFDEAESTLYVYRFVPGHDREFRLIARRNEEGILVEFERVSRCRSRSAAAAVTGLLPWKSQPATAKA